MILVGVIIFLVLVSLLVAGIATLALRPKRGTMLQILDQHARYTAKAARASRRGKEGEMNVWSEAAADLWSQLEKAEARQLPVPRGPIPARELNAVLDQMKEIRRRQTSS